MLLREKKNPKLEDEYFVRFFLFKNLVQGNPANKAAKPTKKINISLLTIPLIKNISLLTGPS